MDSLSDSFHLTACQGVAERNARPITATTTPRLRVFRILPAASASIPVMSCGTQFYLKLKPKNWRNNLASDFASTNVVSMTTNQSYRAMRALLDSVRSQMEVDKQIPVDQAPDSVASMTVEFRNMWVEKYRPERYLDLLSDEGVNRALLHWLKLWDVKVFSREPKFLEPYRNFSKRKTRDDKPTYDAKKYGGVSDFCFTMDQDKRPRFKAALLCGPPGLGKTTLAQVIARHAGYAPMELNASDDRALDVFRTRVESAVVNGNVVTQLEDAGRGQTDRQSAPLRLASDTRQAVESPTYRPKCLIIDEIDGAPANTVEYLVRLLKGEAKVSTGKKKTKKLGLLRPIICICNDLYVPALKSLRQCAMVLRFPPVNRDRLTTRLSDICRGMKVQADSGVLYSLCEKSDDDIRTCLNSLQFATVQGGKLNIQDVTKAAMGCKDQRKQLLKIWDDIFRLPRVTKGADPRAGPLQSKHGSAAGSDRIGHILELVQLGELDKTVNGVFENYLRVHHKDSSLGVASQCADWRSYTDLLERSVYEDQNWFLLGYLGFYPTAVHLHLAQLNLPMFSFPMAQYDTHRRATQAHDITAAFLKDLSPALYRTTKSQSLAAEGIPFLTRIIQPPLRATTMHLLSPAERMELKQVVDLMIAYGLSYHEERTLTGIHTEAMDPPLETISRWPDIQTPAMSTVTRAMVSREVQLRRINVGARVEDGSAEDMDVDLAPAPASAVPARKPLLTTIVQVQSNNTAKLQVWSVYDYFRRQNPSQTSSKPASPVQGTKIWFRYKEGFSNAVCRDVKVKDLM